MKKMETATLTLAKHAKLELPAPPKGVDLRSAPMEIHIDGDKALLTVRNHAYLLRVEETKEELRDPTPLDLFVNGGKGRPQAVRHFVLPQEIVDNLRALARGEPATRGAWELARGRWKKKSYRRATTDLPLWRLLRVGSEPALIRYPDGLRIALRTDESYIKQIREVLKQTPASGELWLQVYLDRTAGFVYAPVCPPLKRKGRRR